MPTHMMNIGVEFHYSPYTKYKDNAAYEIDVNGQWPDGRTMDRWLDKNAR